ncbi:MAG: NAD(P)/FAD-dependent oxidoreductase [Vicinamibacterales bacterium]
MLRIAVVGAGVAGLSAARVLAAAGHDVVVFERGPRPGGRVATLFANGVELPRAGTVDLAFDHGAQYFTVRDQRFASLVDEWMRARLVAKWSGRIVAFDDEGWEDVKPDTERFVAVPSMSALGAHLARGINVHCNVRVSALDRVDGSPISWCVRAQSHEIMGEFDRVIVAVPPNQARTLASHGTTLAAQVAAVEMKPCWAVLVAFEESVTQRFDAAFVSRSPLGWIARNGSKPKRDRTEAWVLHATREWSASHADDRSDTVGPFLLEAFANLIRAGLPRPFFLAARRWREAVADPPLSVGSLHDRERGLSVCGDWCAGSRIEDAFVSGVDAATLSLSSC